MRIDWLTQPNTGKAGMPLLGNYGNKNWVPPGFFL